MEVAFRNKAVTIMKLEGYKGDKKEQGLEGSLDATRSRDWKKEWRMAVRKQRLEERLEDSS